MGYYTHYTLTYKPLDDTQKYDCKCINWQKIPNALYCHICGKPLGWKALNNDIYTYLEDNEAYYAVVSGESCKWYDYEPDMIELSKKFENVIFTLEGSGEESDDLWRAYYLNGKVQYAEAIISYEEFDIKKLREIKS